MLRRIWLRLRRRHFPVPPPQPLTTVLVGGQRLRNIHPRTQCAGEWCSIHNPSRHHMRSWPQNFRADRYLMERTCPHGIGHPDPDDPSTDRLHGCDGCCRAPLHDPEDPTR